jgi:hypothetical protein
MGTDLDVLVVGHCFLEKRSQKEGLKNEYKSSYDLD